MHVPCGKLQKFKKYACLLELDDRIRTVLPCTSTFKNMAYWPVWAVLMGAHVWILSRAEWHLIFQICTFAFCSTVILLIMRKKLFQPFNQCSLFIVNFEYCSLHCAKIEHRMQRKQVSHYLIEVDNSSGLLDFLFHTLRALKLSDPYWWLMG